MMLFLISQITMRISREAKIVLILDSSCLSIMFANYPNLAVSYIWKPNQIECMALNNIHTD